MDVPEYSNQQLGQFYRMCMTVGTSAPKLEQLKEAELRIASVPESLREVYVRESSLDTVVFPGFSDKEQPVVRRMLTDILRDTFERTLRHVSERQNRETAYHNRELRFRY